ncbi:hypothetical protein [[Mycobacterium] nativiensis]|uniref:Uncharacterized protein n=1 Tax=[Mycobacterium] nativiensis TaxID=2855503 RepID=A0ABU5XZP0_9MYCO|nr:hypothetical protein [Mycolicibacter sp. MYC340]MEB3033343.1 hypothetical protein [Mycolicibacter sp. MYC340]
MMTQTTKKIAPPSLTASAAAVATQLAKASAPHPGLMPHAAPGSAPDGAAMTIALGMGTSVTRMSAELSNKAPRVQSTTATGVAQLETQDADNATQLQAVGDAAQSAAVYT